MFLLDQLTAIEQGGLRALCYPRPLPGSPGMQTVANNWLVRGLALPPRAPIQFVRSPVQPAIVSNDALAVLEAAWLELDLPTDGVEEWQENATTYASMPSHDPASYPVPEPPMRMGKLSGPLKEMDGGEVYAYSPEEGNEPTAYGFRTSDSQPRAMRDGPRAIWVEYWGLLSNYSPASAAGGQIVEAIAGPKPYTNLIEFLNFMQPRVNQEGARLVIASVASYGQHQFDAARSIGSASLQSPANKAGYAGAD